MSEAVMRTLLVAWLLVTEVERLEMHHHSNQHE
jgi:hypothetical protein